MLLHEKCQGLALIKHCVYATYAQTKGGETVLFNKLSLLIVHLAVNTLCT